jgi:hypothetical protein
MDKHRHEEFLKFLCNIDREVPKTLTVHMILDNYAPRLHLHFTPTSSFPVEPGRTVVPGADQQGSTPRRLTACPT